ncbi:ClpXP protease specificity-enhancing factor [Paludibacterium yongneupense]|uniref:ClpXP protease specificity-enhancing factor n=1 Tax=Paludibacterium yongneupense TaxID=400061 RepID=UPI00040E294B|nr:ClpXP protease specificity-enhancing factor [Paludibacterium yongneupense]
MSTSTKPYLVRALHEWCTDNGHTPYAVVWVNERTNVPREYVQNNEIVLNIGYGATRDLKIDNDWLMFSARFGGVAQEVSVPMGNIMSIFARETGEGMGFEVELASSPTAVPDSAAPAVAGETPAAATDGDDDRPRPSGRPSLRIVK